MCSFPADELVAFSAGKECFEKRINHQHFPAGISRGTYCIIRIYSAQYVNPHTHTHSLYRSYYLLWCSRRKKPREGDDQRLQTNRTSSQQRSEAYSCKCNFSCVLLQVCCCWLTVCSDIYAERLRPLCCSLLSEESHKLSVRVFLYPTWQETFQSMWTTLLQSCTSNLNIMCVPVFPGLCPAWTRPQGHFSRSVTVYSACLYHWCVNYLLCDWADLTTRRQRWLRFHCQNEHLNKHGAGTLPIFPQYMMKNICCNIDLNVFPQTSACLVHCHRG